MHKPRHLAQIAVLVAGLLAGLLGSAVTRGARPASAATTCSLVPTLQESNVTQGLPSYAQAMSGGTNPLVWGKDTLVKLYLSLPSCAVPGQGIQITGATLAVGGVSSPLSAPIPSSAATGCPAPPSSPNPYCLVPASAYSSTGDSNSTSDPIFTVPGTDLTSAGGVAFTASFTPTVTYRVFSSTTDTVGTSGTLTLAPITQAFDHQSNGLRVLVVPMGDATSSATQWSNGAQNALVSAMNALSRMLPVARGVADLTTPAPTTGPPPGIRYHINSGLLNLGPTGLNDMDMTSPVLQTKFCGGPGHFSGISQQLDSYLQTWNNQNPNNKANRVLGVIDEAVNSTGSSCYFGYADVDGFHAWSRVNYLSGSPAWTAGLATMELGHTLGLSARAPSGITSPVPCGDFAGDSQYHSLDTRADGCSPGRAFNTQYGYYLPNNRTYSRLGMTDSNWNDNNLLAQPQDYQYAQCVLGGSSTACSGVTPPPGSFSAASSSSSTFMLTGQITVDPRTNQSTATVGNSYLTTDSFVVTPPAQSRYVLEYFGSNGAPVASHPSDPVEVSWAVSDHDADGTTVSVPTGDFVSSWPVPSGATQARLVDTAGGATLYQAAMDQFAPGVSPQPAQPTSGLVTAGPASDITNTATVNESSPAVSSTGLLAWASGPSGLVFAPAAHPANTTVIPGSSGDVNPAFTQDGSEVTYEDANGDIWTAKVAWNGTATGAVTLSAQTEIYQSVFDNAVFPVHHPSFSPPTPIMSADQVAVSYNGNIFVVNLPGSQQAATTLQCALPGKVLSQSCEQVTGTALPGNDGTPSWAPTGSRIAYTHGSDVDVVDACASTSSTGACQPGAPSALVVGASNPAWTNGLVAYQSSGDLYLTDPSNPANRQEITHLGSDAQPGAFYSTSSGGWLAFQRQIPTGSASQTDIELSQLSAPVNNGSMTYTATATDQDNDPHTLRAEFVRSCPSANGGSASSNVLAAALAPNDVNGQQARFQVSLNPAAIPTLGCAGGTVYVQVSDGWLLSPLTAVGTIAASSTPVTATVSLQTNTFRGGHLVGIVGQAYDADLGPIPSADFAWSVSSPCGGTPYTASGTDRIYIEPPACTQAYTATLTVSENGRSASAQASFTVTANHAPTVTISSPTDGSSYLPGSAVTLSGSASDAEDGPMPASSLAWTVVAPDGTVQHPSGNPSTIHPVTPGTWAVTLSAVDSDGATGSATVSFTVGYQAKVNFSPNTINAPPLPSDPNWVTTNTWLASQDLSQVNPATVHIVQIGPDAAGRTYTSANGLPSIYAGYQYGTGAGCLSAPCYSPANSWTVSGTFGSNQSATAQFDRITLANFLASVNMVNEYVPVYITGSAGTSWSFFGVDPSSPNVKGTT